MVIISLTNSSTVDSLEFLPLFSVLNNRGIANPLDATTFSKDDLKDYIEELNPKLVICSNIDMKLGWFVGICDALQIPIFTLKIDLHFRSIQVPRVVRKLSPVVTNQLSNVRPVCTVLRVGRHIVSKSLQTIIHDHNDLAFLILTKNTKKLVPLTHLNVLESLELSATALELSANDKTILCFNLAHAQGLMVLLTAFFSGSTVVLPGINESFWAKVREFQITWFVADPAIHASLLNMHLSNSTPNESKKKTALRFILSTGSSLPDEQLLAMESSYHTQVLTCYSMTEAGFLVSLQKPKSQRKLGTCGNPIIPLFIWEPVSGHPAKPGVVGEILIRGPTCSQSYYLSSTHENDWISEKGIRYLRTGDNGILDERGFLTVVSADQSLNGPAAKL